MARYRIFPAGILFFSAGVGMNTLLTVVKPVLRIVMDACFLPGTSNGTEILWLYLIQWNKKFSALCFIILSTLTVVGLSTEVNTMTAQSLNEIDNDIFRSEP
jgi:hypothetical protein